MEALVQEGKARNIGVSNYNVQSIMDLQQYATIQPAVLQIEYHPQLQQPALLGFCQKHGIAVTGFSSFGGLSYQVFNPKAENLLEHPLVQELAKKYGKAPSQILLRFCLQKKVAVIPKSSSENRLRDNLDIFGFELEEDDVKRFELLNVGVRYSDPAEYAKIPIFA